MKLNALLPCLTAIIFLACNTAHKAQTPAETTPVKPSFVTWDKKKITLGPVKKGEKRENLLRVLFVRYTQDLDHAEDRLNTLLYMLKNDGYLADTDGIYYFRSPLIRDFWYHRFVQ